MLDALPSSFDNEKHKTFGRVETIDKGTLKPLNQPCETHEFYRDGSEDTPDWYSVKCKRSSCGIGKLIRK